MGSPTRWNNRTNLVRAFTPTYWIPVALLAEEFIRAGKEEAGPIEILSVTSYMNNVIREMYESLTGHFCRTCRFDGVFTDAWLRARRLYEE